MKRDPFKYPFITSFVIVLLFSTISLAQEISVNNYKMIFNFNTEKQADNSRLLEVSFIGKNKKNRKDKIPIYNAEIKFFNILNDVEILLGTSKTSNEGIAQIILPENHNYLTDKNGNINLIAQFESTEALSEETAEITVKDLHLELNLTEIDSVKTVLVKAFTLDSLGIETLVEEAEIIFFIQGMLSKMKIEEGTISDGEYEFEMPTDIPGDVNGNLIVISTIEDHDEFGTVKKKETVHWGTFNKKTKQDTHKLWTKAAPIWMYVVLTILLVGVWANYLYTIINLFKIKKEGDDLKLKIFP